MATRKSPTAKKPAAAKKAATRKPAQRESVAESWAEGYRAFTDAAKERFAFLVREHGYAEPVVRVEPPDALVTFTKEESFVRVATEYAGEAWVVVKSWEGEPYGLHAIIAAIDPAYAEQKPVPARSTLTDDELRAMVTYWATFLEEHASEVLGANPALVARFHAQQTALQAQRQ